MDLIRFLVSLHSCHMAQTGQNISKTDFSGYLLFLVFSLMIRPSFLSFLKANIRPFMGILLRLGWLVVSEDPSKTLVFWVIFLFFGLTKQHLLGIAFYFFLGKANPRNCGHQLCRLMECLCRIEGYLIYLMFDS